MRNWNPFVLSALLGLGSAACMAGGDLESAHSDYDFIKTLAPGVVIRDAVLTGGPSATDATVLATRYSGYPGCYELAVRVKLDDTSSTGWGKFFTDGDPTKTGTLGNGHIASLMREAGVINDVEWKALNSAYWWVTPPAPTPYGQERARQIFGDQTGYSWLVDRVADVVAELPACTAGWYLVGNPNGSDIYYHEQYQGKASGLFCGDYLDGIGSQTNECEGQYVYGDNDTGVTSGPAPGAGDMPPQGPFTVTLNNGATVMSGQIFFSSEGYCQSGFVRYTITDGSFSSGGSCTFGTDGTSSWYDCPFDMNNKVINPDLTGGRQNWVQQWDFPGFALTLAGQPHSFTARAYPECIPIE